MLNALESLPEDPVELRQVTQLLAKEVKAQALMIEKLKAQLSAHNKVRFGSKGESLDQLALYLLPHLPVGKVPVDPGSHPLNQTVPCCVPITGL